MFSVLEDYHSFRTIVNSQMIRTRDRLLVPLYFNPNFLHRSKVVYRIIFRYSPFIYWLIYFGLSHLMPGYNGSKIHV